MIKKILLCMLCFMFAFSAYVFAEDASAGAGTENASAQEDAQPSNERGGTMRGQRPQDGTEAPQTGENVQDGAAQPPQAPPGGGDAADDVQEGADGAQGGDAENAQPAFGGNRGGRPQDGAAPEWMDEGVQEQAEAAAESVSAGTIGSLLQEYATPVISVILLAFAFVFVIFYKRKSY